MYWVCIKVQALTLYIDGYKDGRDIPFYIYLNLYEKLIEIRRKMWQILYLET